MKNQRNRHNGRYNNNRSSNRQQTIYRNTGLESSGPCGKFHGTALQLFEKYQVASKDAALQNDIVLAQICLQYADHYQRLQNIAIENETALRDTQNADRKKAETPAPAPTAESASVTEPSKPAETTSAPAPAEKIIDISDEKLQKMDLSIPIKTIQQQEKRSRSKVAAAE